MGDDTLGTVDGMTPQELASRLIDSGKPITPSRVQKFARHVTSRAMLDETLVLLSLEDRALVEASIEPYLRGVV